MKLPKFAFLFVIFAPLANAQSDCLSHAKTELETVYCKVAATPEGRSLPLFSDFRRNNAKVQALLLKQPARKLGITLPEVPKTSVAPRPSNKPDQPRTSVASQNKPANKVSTQKKPTQSAVQKRVEVVQDPLQQCGFAGESIRCPRTHYQLRLNQQNAKLVAGALGAANPLSLPAFSGQLNDKAAVNNYLADSYTHYIDKMLVIGLGASTMTYTKFHYTFWDLVEKKQDFAQRVNTMYEYLKQDKASMGVQSRYDNALPGGLDWCTFLSTNIIVCDNGKRNWVYTPRS